MSTKQRIVHYVREYHALNHCGPTYREIADGLGIALNTVHSHIAGLKRMGIMQGSKKRRSLQVVERTAALR